MKIQIPDKKNIQPTNQEDPLRYYYLPAVRRLYLKRLRMTLDMIGLKKRSKVLEIGYGSGILFPELSKRFDEIYGIDIHDKIDLVETMLKKEGLTANLKVGDILNLPYKDEEFDSIVCISVLEHIPGSSLDNAVSEIHRVLIPGGIAVVGFPTVGKKMDLFFRIIGYHGIDQHHVSGEKEIMAALGRKLTIVEVTTFPKFLSISQSLYVTCKYIKEE
ncbi:MAG: class I SAM-dependent methyltransferase [bacterium]|nr:class I SAM-dependent methyltransferase [bacterium]